MIQRTRYSLFIASLFMLPALSPQAQVVLQNSEHSFTVIPAEGNGRCVDYGANAFIREMGANISCPSPTAVVGGTVLGSDGNTADWSYDCGLDQLRFFNVSGEGINYTITKRSRNITWYPYGPSTFLADSRITNQDPVTGAILQTSSFALCYGLPRTDVSEPEPFPDCNFDDVNGWLGGIACPAGSNGTVVTLWQPFNPASNDARTFQCVCNQDNSQSAVIFQPCDPTGHSGDLPACYSKDSGQTEATLLMESDADPTTCTTSGGTRSCKCVDNPFTAVNECQ